MTSVLFFSSATMRTDGNSRSFGRALVWLLGWSLLSAGGVGGNGVAIGPLATAPGIAVVIPGPFVGAGFESPVKLGAGDFSGRTILTSALENNSLSTRAKSTARV